MRVSSLALVLGVILMIPLRGDATFYDLDLSGSEINVGQDTPTADLFEDAFPRSLPSEIIFGQAVVVEAVDPNPVRWLRLQKTPFDPYGQIDFSLLAPGLFYHSTYQIEFEFKLESSLGFEAGDEFTLFPDRSFIHALRFQPSGNVYLSYQKKDPVRERCTILFERIASFDPTVSTKVKLIIDQPSGVARIWINQMEVNIAELFDGSASFCYTSIYNWSGSTAPTNFRFSHDAPSGTSTLLKEVIITGLGDPIPRAIGREDQTDTSVGIFIPLASPRDGRWKIQTSTDAIEWTDLTPVLEGDRASTKGILFSKSGPPSALVRIVTEEETIE